MRIDKLLPVSTSKTKTLTIAKEPVQCKLVIDDTLLEQVTTFKYLGGIVSSDRNTSWKYDSKPTMPPGYRDCSEMSPGETNT